ncbi:MAG: translesion error-prone DNA polymerase V autoproteolytic subunit [Desulfovibrionaceae bacterium]
MTHLPPDLELLGVRTGPSLELPWYLAEVSAGFPSPADDFIDRALDLNEHLIRHPQATFFVRAHGDSMLGAGIHDQDLLIVDRALQPGNNAVVIAALNGELTVKRLRRQGTRLLLQPENADYEPIEITPETDFEIWGQVTHVIHKV